MNADIFQICKVFFIVKKHFDSGLELENSFLEFLSISVS